ncbi:PiggyBac transposable element-derived protein 2 [Plakobranchus ocellatus]|uniref:PiggyBac transposable element-derived protein 2 n=1 Tax=Plakobranchus ocellatus TaxID=259542 RepID=A0AAV4D4P3_9GAST|nr:PiggyBac transposable element-derived protein 2 [Plakobranchus ocellatus]
MKIGVLCVRSCVSSYRGTRLKQKDQGKRSRGKQREKLIEGLTDWLKAGKSLEAIEATKDRKKWRTMIANAVKQDEYNPRDDELDSDDSDFGHETRPRKRQKRTKTNKDPLESEGSDDDIPLATIRQSLLRQRGEVVTDEDVEEILTQMLDEPMWGRDVPFTPVDTTFTGELDATPDDVYGYFRELVNDKMLSNIRDQTNIYALEKNGEEMNVSVKEVEKFIGVYLRMGVMKVHCQRAYCAAKTRYSPVADVFSRSRYEQLASTIHFTDNNKPEPTIVFGNYSLMLQEKQ